MRGRRLALSVVAVAALLLAGRALSVAYADFTWYDSLAARQVWTERTLDTAAIQSLGFLLAMLFTLLNLATVRRSLGGLMRHRRLANVEFGEAVPPGQMRLAAVAASGIVALAIMRLLPSWDLLALARLGVDFRESDPYLQHDLSFYVTRVPLERAAFSWATALVVTVSVIVFVLCALSPGVRWRSGLLHLSTSVRRHLGLLTALLLLLCAWSYRLDSYELLTGGGRDGPLFGYVDHQWMLPGLLALTIVSAATAVIVAVSAWTGQLRTSLIAIMVAVAFAAVVQEILPFAFGRLTPRARARMENAPYVATRADFTARAFTAGLEDAGERLAPFGQIERGPAGKALTGRGDTIVAPGASGMLLVDAPMLDVAGPSLGTGLSRLAQAWAARNFGLLSDTLRRRARIMRVRDVAERVRKLYPLFTVGMVPEPLYRADTLYWTVPLYSSSDSYPLAEHREILGEIRSYFHRIGTAFINARTGRVWVSFDLPPDPVAAGWVRSFASAQSLAAARSIQRSLAIATPAPVTAGLVSDTSFRASVARFYDRMRAALSAGDLREFGVAYDSLGSLVARGRK